MVYNLSNSSRIKRSFRTTMGKVNRFPLGLGVSKKIRVKFTAFNNALALVALWILLAGTSGCAGCLAGPSFTIGTSATETGVSRFEMGKVRSFQVARYDDVIDATRRAAKAFSLDLKEEKIEDHRGSFRYLDDKGTSINILIESRSDSLTSIWISVGIFESKAMAIVVMKQIIHELAIAGKYLEQWEHVDRI